MTHRIIILPEKQNIDALHGSNLLEILHANGLAPDAPCGGAGSCGKCKVLVGGREVRACQTTIDRDMVVAPAEQKRGITLTGGDFAELSTLEKSHRIPVEGVESTRSPESVKGGYLLAVDIGTTTVVGYLLDGKSGLELASESRLNPQTTFGADVISRIRGARKGQMSAMTGSIRSCVSEMIEGLCERTGVAASEIGVVSVVGNPAMQQLFLGIRPDNLAEIPFRPVLTEAKLVNARDYLPMCEQAELIIVPDISGFVGADTLACVLATGMDREEEMTLLVDIGTNGEMVLGNRKRMVSCSTAAGPALEGANIEFGMRGMTGAIDHVWVKNGELMCSVIGGGDAAAARGICGSGLIDGVAAALELGLINPRGRVKTEDRCIHLTGKIYLTQEDIREVQMAKGAIAAGIQLMADHLGINLQEIDKVYLAGAFGTFMDPRAACRIGLLPAELEGKISAVGNAAGSGAKMLACDRAELDHVQQLAMKIEFLELATVPGFQRTFAERMRFSGENRLHGK